MVELQLTVKSTERRDEVCVLGRDSQGEKGEREIDDGFSMRGDEFWLGAESDGKCWSKALDEQVFVWRGAGRFGSCAAEKILFAICLLCLELMCFVRIVG